MTKREQLLALADRAEKEGYAGNHPLEGEIFKVMGGLTGTFMGRRITDHVGPNYEGWFDLVTEDGRLHLKARQAPLYFGSLDDADTLRPEGCICFSGGGARRLGLKGYYAIVGLPEADEERSKGLSAESEAAARTVAYLRARAKLLPEDAA